MNPRNIPRDMFLGIYWGTHSSEYTEGLVPRNSPKVHFLGNSRWKFRGTFSQNFRGKFRGRSPSVYSEEISDELVVLGVSSEICFLGIPSENSEGVPRKMEFPRSYFRELVLSVCRRNNVIPTTYRRFFPSVCRCFLVVLISSCFVLYFWSNFMSHFLV